MKRDLLCAGISVADAVVRPVSSLPPRGKLALMKSIELHTGGCALNTSAVAARLGLKCGIVTAAGKDAFGDFLLKRMKEEAIDARGAARVPKLQTAATAVMVSRDGERSFLHVQGASAAITERLAPDGLLRGYRALHLAGFYMMPRLDGAPARRLLVRARRLGLVTSLDTCWDPKRRWHLLLSCLDQVDYYMPSFEEASQVFSSTRLSAIAEAALRAGVRRAVILKMGAKGCFALERGGNPLRVPAYRVRQVDSTGAGDAFDAGFLTGLMRGWPMPRSLKLGCAAGALCVAGTGALGRVESLRQAIRLTR